MSQYFSGDETTERESLKDTITVRAAYQTPMIRQLPQTSVRNRVEEWSLDEPFQSSESVRDISDPHAQTREEGADYTYRTPFYPVRPKAIAEIAHFGMELSGTDRTVVMAGADSTFDYRAGQLFTKTMNHIDNILMYGQGSPETSGKTAAQERRTMGLIYATAFTGLERVHGTKTSMEDPYGTVVPSTMFSVFQDFNHSNITAQAFYDNLIARALNAGSDFDTTPWMFRCGYTMMSRISRFLIADGGTPINDRNVDAASGGGHDFLNWIRLADGTVVGFRTNRWLDERTSTFSIDNTTQSSPHSPDTEGSVGAKTFSGDQTLVGWEPGSVRIGWLREPAFEHVPTSGDYSRLVCKAEFMLMVDHPLCVIGAGNGLS